MDPLICICMLNAPWNQQTLKIGMFLTTRRLSNSGRSKGVPLLASALLPKSAQYLLFNTRFSNCPLQYKEAAKLKLFSDMEETSGGNGDAEFPRPLSRPPSELSRQVEFDRAMLAEAAVKAGPALSPKDFIYEDEWMIAVNKPSGVYCDHVLSSIPQLLASDAGIDAASLELHLANRLDRDTSGVMIITKLHKVAGKLVKAFTDRKVKKTYLALCIGPAPDWNEINIESGHGRSKFGAWRVYSRNDVGRILPGGTVVREMATHFKVLSVNGYCKIGNMNVECAENSSYQGRLNSRENEPITVNRDIEARGLTDNVEKLVVTEQISQKTRGDSKDPLATPDLMKSDEVLIRAYPQSGRTHQIRLHCQYLGLPIRGDVKYEGPHIWKGTTYANHALHAESLCFEHPVTSNFVKLYAPLPQWVMEACSIYSP